MDLFNGIAMINRNFKKGINILIETMVGVILCSKSLCATAEPHNGNLGVRDIVEAFCQAEFDGMIGVGERKELITLNPSKIKKWKETESAISPFAITPESDSVVVIAAYKMQNKKIAIATVSYKRLARRVESTGKVGMLKLNYSAEDVVNLTVRNVDGYWRIYEPPVPRIGVKALIAIYENSLKSYFPEWFADASKEEIELYNQQVQDLLLLKKLASKEN